MYYQKQIIKLFDNVINIDNILIEAIIDIDINHIKNLYNDDDINIFMYSIGSHVQYDQTPDFSNQDEKTTPIMVDFYNRIKEIVDHIIEFDNRYKQQNKLIKPLQVSENKCVIHIIESSINNSINRSELKEIDINEIIDRYYPLLWTQMKIGDLVEDVTYSGYRSDGRYYVDENTFVETKEEKTEGLSESNPNDWMIGRKLIVKSLYAEYDDYGSIPPHFLAIIRFPIYYFQDDNLIVNNPYNINVIKYDSSIVRFKSSWHNSAILLDFKQLHLNTINEKSLKRFMIGHDNRIVSYFTFTYNNVKYSFGG